MTIDEIFAAMPAEAVADAHEYLVIDPVTRTITVPESEKVFGVEGDGDAERKYFLCTRYVGNGLDLASMFLTINYRNAQGEEDGYLVTDVAVVGDNVTFSWEIWPNVVAFKGTIQFAVCADLPNTSSRRGPDWNTTMAQGEVLEGLDPDRGDVLSETSDVVTQLRAETAAQTEAVEAAGAAQVAAVKAQGTTTTQEAVEAIQAQGAATLATIPAEYKDLEATVDKLTRDRAAAIVCQAEGASIQVQDASNDPLQGLRIFGKSTQDGTPTPEAPVEIVSTPAPVVTVCAKNFCTSQDCGVIFPCRLKKGTTYTVSVDNAADDAMCLLVYDNQQMRLQSVKCTNDNGARRYAILTPTDNIYYAMWAWANAPVVENGQIETGDKATAYEPYTGQTLPITTPSSLSGIPVASGGNYTDENGQQWIADEVDLARGVYVQRVKKIILDGSNSFTIHKNLDAADKWLYTVYSLGIDTGVDDRGYCDKLQYRTAADMNAAGANTPETAGYSASNSYGVLYINIGYLMAENTVEALRTVLSKNPYTFLSALKTPVETPLNDVEVQTFLAMHSNKPTTTVLNDAGAHMVLEYAADPKTFICNQIAAAIAANN